MRSKFDYTKDSSPALFWTRQRFRPPAMEKLRSMASVIAGALQRQSSWQGSPALAMNTVELCQDHANKNLRQPVRDLFEVRVDGLYRRFACLVSRRRPTLLFQYFRDPEQESEQSANGLVDS